ncbi:Processing alpha glucosidase I [Paecilomyces lecythidis]|uniref:Processing alpha glucosidase I n=1 Tax=Paecilomyces lecythidis TaxID=3004212 RepID=A0ABR3YFI0_9EURO
MAEPPAKRARRTDSSAMWDMNDKRERSSEIDTDYDRSSRREPPSREERNGHPSKPDRYYDRSRSPGRNGSKTRSRTPPRGPRMDRREDRRDNKLREDARHSNGVPEHRRPSRAPDGDDAMDVDMLDSEDPDDIESLMRKTMGFTRFRTTQNTKVPGNNVYGVRKEKKTEYRQYMNRSGGFNRPLSPSR